MNRVDRPLNRQAQRQPERNQATLPAPRRDVQPVIHEDRIAAVEMLSHPLLSPDLDERIPESIAQAREIILENIPADLAGLSHRIAVISQKTNVIYDKQIAIYTSHGSELDAILRNSRSPISQRFRERTQGRPFFRESLARITNPSRLSGEVENAMELAVFENSTGLDRLKREEVAKLLGKSLGRSISDNIIRTFKSDFRTLIHEFDLSVEDLRATGDANDSVRNRKLQFQEQILRQAFEDSLASSIKKLDELHPLIVDKMESVAKAALNTDRDNLPFRVLSRLPEKAVSVSLKARHDGTVSVTFHVIDKVLEDDNTVVPPVPKPNEKFDEPEIQRAVQLSGRRAGRCAISESLLSNSDPLRNPLAAALAVGLASRQANWTILGTPGSALFSSAASTGIVMLQNFFVGQRLCLSHLEGFDFSAKLSDVGSDLYDARANLVSSFGARWLLDFEKWARSNTNISLQDALSIAKALRKKMNTRRF